jgi:diguanylate cyclase (GGDEF)-like protein
MLRPYDSVARWGGDEFLVLTQASGAHDVNTLGERIRATIEETARLHGPHGEPIRLTVSVGGYFAELSEGMESMLQHADQALYLAKTAGRNVFRSYPV